MNLDQPWKIAAVIGLLALLRIVWGLWRSAPARRFLVELLDSALIAFVLVFVLIRPLVVQAFFIPSESMEPTLLPGDRILVNKFIYRLDPPQRGDIIVFNAPPAALQGGERKDFVKRLIGVPGDEITVRQEEGVFVGGKLFQDAPGVPLPDYNWPADAWGRPTGKPYRVPPGNLLVLGDNRNLSNDSHRWTDMETGQSRPELDSREVLGKAMVIFWPLPRLHLVSDNAQAYLPPPPSAQAHAAPR